MIRFRKASFLICCVFIAALAVVILGGWLSSGVAVQLAQAFGMLSEENMEEFMQIITMTGNLLLVAEYFLLGAFVCWLVAMLRNEALEVFLVSASCSFTFACVCETLKMILPYSSGSFSNLLWSAVGIAAGTGILALIFRFCIKANRRPVHAPRHAAKKPGARRREMPKFKDMD